MKRFAKIATACVVIVALMVDSVTACWFFARRMRCRPCPPRCYSAPLVYSSCVPGASWSPMPSQPLPSVPDDGMGRGSSPMPPAPDATGRARPTPADREREPSPSDRGDAAPLQPLPDRGNPPDDAEPMPEPPADSTEPTPSPFDNPFGPPRDTQPPAPAEDSQPAVDDMPPAPGATETDNPFAPQPGATDSAPPADTSPAPAVDNPFAPQPGANEATPPAETTPAPELDNPFAPRDSAPPPATDESNPFAPRSGAADGPAATDQSSTEPTTENVFAPPATESQPATDNPFAPRAADAGSTPADPFRLPTDAAQPPMSEVNEAPMDNAPPAPIDDAPPAPISDVDDEATEPAPADSAPSLDNPFAEPVGDRLSSSRPESQPADAMRLWTDITGKHRVRGQMKKILMAERKVRILKDTGKYTTVPFARLSEADRTFVARHTIEPSTLLAETR